MHTYKKLKHSFMIRIPKFLQFASKAMKLYRKRSGKWSDCSDSRLGGRVSVFMTRGITLYKYVDHVKITKRKPFLSVYEPEHSSVEDFKMLVSHRLVDSVIYFKVESKTYPYFPGLTNRSKLMI